MEINAYSKTIRKLRGNKITVRPIRRRGGWVHPEHDSSFMNDGATMGIVVPVTSGNIVVDPLFDFTNDDRELFASQIGIEDVLKLNVHVKKNYWIGNTVTLDKNGLVLDLSNHVDFAKFLILRSDTNRIAPNWKSRFEKGTYKFAIVEEGEEVGEKVTKIDDVKKAYKLLGGIDFSTTKMKDFLYVYYLSKKEAKRPPRDATIEFLKSELGKIVEDDLQLFLEILEDDDYDVKLLIQKAANCGALLRDKHQYTVPGADKPIGVLSEVIAFIRDSRNQEFEMKLIQQVENTRDN